MNSKAGIVAALMVTGIAACAQEVFYARDFFYTREFKMGSDLFESFPSTSGPEGIYIAGAFQFPPYGLDVQAFMRRYDASGDEIWTKQILAANAFPSLLAADAA